MKKKKTVKKNIKPLLVEEPLVSIIILSDSHGYRMRSYGASCLVEINNKKLIDIQIQAIKKVYKNFEIILSIGFENEKVFKYLYDRYSNLKIRIVENQIFNQSNSCESLRLALNNTWNDKIVIIDGNLLFSSKTLKQIDKNHDSALIQKFPSESLQIGININQNNIAQHFSFGAFKQWSEIISFNKIESIELLRKILHHPDSKKKFSFEMFNEMIKNKIEIKCLENLNHIYKIDNIKTYHHIKENYEILNI